VVRSAAVSYSAATATQGKGGRGALGNSGLGARGYLDAGMPCRGLAAIRPWCLCFPMGLAYNNYL